MAGGATGGEHVRDSLGTCDRGGDTTVGDAVATTAAGGPLGLGSAAGCATGVFLGSSLRLLSTTGAKSLHTGNSQGLMLQLSVMAMRLD